MKKESIANWTTRGSIPTDNGIDGKWQRGTNLQQKTEAE